MRARVSAYEQLDIRPGASRDEVRAAWREFARVHHPDRGGNSETFKAGLDAYQHLSGRAAGVAGPEVVFYRRPRGAGVPLAWCRERRSARKRPKRVI